MTEETVPSIDLSIISGVPTAEELAAVTATISAMVEESAADTALDAGGGMSAWQRSQRSIRGPVVPGRGMWRGFDG